MCHDLEEVLTCFRGISHDIWNVPVSCSVGKLEIQINPQDCDYSNESASADDDDDDDETKDDENRRKVRIHVHLYRRQHPHLLHGMID